MLLATGPECFGRDPESFMTSDSKTGTCGRSNRRWNLTENGDNLQRKSARVRQRATLNGALVLASRSEVKRGQGKQFEKARFKVRPAGSWLTSWFSLGWWPMRLSLSPPRTNGMWLRALLVLSAGGFITTLEGSPLLCNKQVAADLRSAGLWSGVVRGVVHPGERPLIGRLTARPVNVAPDS